MSVVYTIACGPILFPRRNYNGAFERAGLGHFQRLSQLRWSASSESLIDTNVIAFAESLRLTRNLSCYIIIATYLLCFDLHNLLETVVFGIYISPQNL